MNAVRGMSAQEKANLIPYKIRHALAAKGNSVAFTIWSLDPLLCTSHNLTDCGTEECIRD